MEGNVGNDVMIELIARAAERFQGSLAAYGPAEFQRRVARVAGANHLAVPFVGAWRDKNGKIHYLRHAGPEHVLCYAPTRSGKGVGLILPTLLSWQQSVFVTDLKGSCTSSLPVGVRNMLTTESWVAFFKFFRVCS